MQISIKDPIQYIKDTGGRLDNHTIHWNSECDLPKCYFDKYSNRIIFCLWHSISLTGEIDGIPFARPHSTSRGFFSVKLDG